ncbi:MAG: hypothetical protein ACSHX7_12015 [Luteolibacter sp.]
MDQPGRIAETISEPAATDNGDFLTSVEFAWASRYLAEGRTAFDDNGIFSALAAVGYRDVSLEVWQGFSDGSSAREFQASLFYAFDLEVFDMALGLTHINDTDGGDDDLDISIAFTGSLLAGLEWDAIYYYGFDRKGSYLEVGVSRTWETECVDVSLGAHLGSNFGYVMDGHEGADHFVLSADVSRELVEGLTVSAGYSYYFDIDADPITDPEDGDLFDGSVVGFAVEYVF